MPASTATGQISRWSSVPARGIDNMRIPREWRPALDGGRLLILSPFPATARRPTAELASQRNGLVSDLAQRVFIAHAASDSKTEAFARNLAATGKPLLTLDSSANANLVQMGARLVRLNAESLDVKEIVPHGS